ncbi:uncharacterized protein JCM15063_002846 [Sporobolomyces koalae]|uniref:uncharacterized protein n=1 Tax=Sporobolomyces koalae TaxID=500713 RepID=UPI00316B6D18
MQSGHAADHAGSYQHLRHEREDSAVDVAVSGSTSAAHEGEPLAKRPKRTYRACQPCRSRKLKCDLGDPENPSKPPCRRCRREARECVFVVRNNSKNQPPSASQDDALPVTTSAPQRPQGRRRKTQSAQNGAGKDDSGREGSDDSSSMGGPGSTGPLPLKVAKPEVAGYYFHPPPHSTGASGPQPPVMPAPPLASGSSYQHPVATRAVAANRPRSQSIDSRLSNIQHPAYDDEYDEHEHEHDHDHEHDGDGDGTATGHGAGPTDANVLLSSTLHNPSDALRLLATASSLRATVPTGTGGPEDHTIADASGASDSEVEQSWNGQGKGKGKGKGKERATKESKESGKNKTEAVQSRWERFVPVAEGMLSIAEAEVLLSFFETEMSPLYPLLSPLTFSPSHLPHLTSTESLLLASMITISARYSALPSASRARAIHKAVADYIRDELIGLLDGSGELRHISSVEALLLLTEWPPIADRRKGKNRRRAGTELEENGSNSDSDEAAELLRTSTQYDGMSWSFIGCAVRLAQELGIHNLYTSASDRKADNISWHEERCLRTWIYCYNADRHVSVRLGRNAVIQAYMSSSWWEQVTSRASGSVRREGYDEVWAERSLPQGLIAALMGTIQERLYPNKEITRSMLRTGHWESFIRSLDHELQMMMLKAKNMLQQQNVEATLLQIEFEYVRLYGNAIALRALQERLRRAVKANDLWFVSPSLLNLQEGQWVIDALNAAQSILSQTVGFLAPKGFLRVAPSRIFQRILFAATFLFKALAVGVVEHGQSKVLGLLHQAITALHESAVDRQHIARGFAALLRRLQAQCKPTLLSRAGVRPVPDGQNPAETTPAATTATAAAAPPTIVHSSPQHPHAPLAPHPVGAAGSGNVASPALPPLPPAPLEPPAHPATAPHHHPLPVDPLQHPHYHHHPHHHHAPQSAFNWFPIDPVAASHSLDIRTEFPEEFDWDPAAAALAVGKEQDLLFQSLWGGGGANGLGGDQLNPALNLFGTLVGDEFGADY